MAIVLGFAVILSVWMRNRTATPTNDPTAATGDAAGRLPYNATAPVVWKTDIFNQITNPPAPDVTITIPQVPPGGGRPAPPGSVTPSILDVQKGWHVSQWIEDQKDPAKAPNGNPALTWTLLEQLNPGISANVNWNKDPAKTTFKANAKYRVK
jgi:hypothetical protein